MHSIQKYELLNLRCDFIIKHKGGILMITKENELWFLKKKKIRFFFRYDEVSNFIQVFEKHDFEKGAFKF